MKNIHISRIIRNISIVVLIIAFWFYNYYRFYIWTHTNFKLIDTIDMSINLLLLIAGILISFNLSIPTPSNRVAIVFLILFFILLQPSFSLLLRFYLGQGPITWLASRTSLASSAICAICAGLSLGYAVRNLFHTNEEDKRPLDIQK